MKRSVTLRLFTLLIAVIMTVVSLPTSAYALKTSGSDQIHYIKEVRLAQAETRAEAKASLEDDGFIFLEGNLNEGTGEDGVWLGYKTTINPAEAIYDMKLMNTDGGFTLTSMEEAIKAQESAFAEMTADLELLIDEFVEVYKSEHATLPAQKAYMALNFFRIVDDETKDDEENGLGYQLVNGGMTTKMLTEIIMLCDSAIVDSIVKILTMGIQLNNESWIKELSKLGPYEEDVEYGLNEEGQVRLDDDEIKRRATQLEAVIRFYADAYNAFDELGLVSGKFDDSFNIKDATYKTPSELTADEIAAKKADESRYKFYKVVFDEFEKYSYGDDQTLKDFFCNEPGVEELYPLVSVLSDGEYAAMSYGCFLESATGALTTEEDFKGYDEAYADATKDVDSLYLYIGVDEALLSDDSIVAFTDSATRHMAATGELEFYENKTLGEMAWEKGVLAAKCIGALGLCVMGIPRVVAGLTILTTSIIGAIAGNAAQSAVAAAIIKFGSMIGGPWTLLITVAAVAMTLLISWLISVIDEAINGTVDWDANPMPEYIYDVRSVSFTQKSENDGIATEYVKRSVFCFYEAVRDENGEILDLNVRSTDASQWIGLYVSYDNLGDDAKPIKAEDLLVKTGNGETPEGYKPLSRFDEVIAYNLNQFDEDDDVNGVYVFYKQDENAPPVKQSAKYYISDIYLQKGESDAHCIALLEAMGYTPLNVNLSPDTYSGSALGWGDKIYTYIGYKTTTLPSEAYRDLRIVHGPSQGDIQLGAANYADCGSNGYVTLYATKYEGSGSPILAGGLQVVNKHADASAGYEPVNFFSGGPAISFNYPGTNNGRYAGAYSYYLREAPQMLLYFLPETTFTEGTKYISGISYHIINYNEVDYIKKFADEYIEYLEQETGKKYNFVSHEQLLRDIMMHDSGYHQIVDTDLFDTVAYHYTYNPYRAIYGIKMTTLDGSDMNLKTENVGYVKWSAVMLDTRTGTGLTLFYRETYESFTSFWLALSGDFYVSGNPRDDNYYDSKTGKMTEVQPLTPEDVICLTDYNKNDYQDLIENEALGFKAVNDIFFEGTTKINHEYFENYWTQWNRNHFTIYVKKNTEDRPYISGVMAADELSIYRASGGHDAGMSRGDVTDAMLYKQLAAQGATDFCRHRVSMLQWNNVANPTVEMNAMRFGYARTATKKEALTDMFIYVNDVSFDEPQDTIYRGNVAYKLLCDIPYNLTGYEEAPAPGVYLYGTTDTRAGSRITEFTLSDTPFMVGYETLRTQNDRSPWSELRDIMKQNMSTHFLSWARELFEDLMDFFAIKDDVIVQYFYEHVPYYIHIKREGDSHTTLKPYVDNIYIASYSDVRELALEELFDQGAEEYINVNLNKDTTFGSTTVLLGYSRTESPKKAIKDIVAYHKKNPPNTLTASDRRTYTLESDVDLNKNSGGDYIYLYSTKEGSRPITELIISFDERKVNNVTYVKDKDGDMVAYRDYVTKMWESDDYSDLNDGAGGEYIYLYYKGIFANAKEGTYTEPNYGVDKTFNRKDQVPNIYINPKGKYIAELFVMDKETIRKELGYSDCTKVTERQVFDRLTSMGASEIVPTPISINSDEFNSPNNNKVYIGYSRTNNKIYAIKDIAIHVELLSYAEPPESLSVGRKGYYLVAQPATKVKQLPKAVNLLAIGDGNQMAFPKMYLYVSYSSNSLPITDICVDGNPLLQGWNTVRSSNEIDAFIDVQNQALKQYELADKDDLDSKDEELVYTDSLFEWMDDLAELFDPAEEEVAPFYIHTKNYTENSLDEARPYIEDVFLAAGDSKHDALTQLVAFVPDGYIDIDLNQDAGGKHVYLAYKKTSKSTAALRDLMIYEGSDPANIRRVLVGNMRIRYELTAGVDLNTKAGGDYLYLYATNSKSIGDPIKTIGVVEDVIPTHQEKCGIEMKGVYLVERDEATNIDKFTDECIDINKNASGDYLYMYMIRETEGGHRLEGNNMRVEHEDPTCGDDGYHLVTESCVDCKKDFSTETILPATGLHVDATGDGDHRCDVCRERDVTSHTPGEPKQEDFTTPYCVILGTCHERVYCTECNAVLSDTLLTTVYDPDNHYDGNDSNHNCDYCGAIDIEPHTPGSVQRKNYKAATCANYGSYSMVVECTECGLRLSEEFVLIPPTGDHVEGYPITSDHVKPTCTKPGSYREVVNCIFCGIFMGERIVERPPNYFDGHTAAEPIKEEIIEPTCAVDGSYRESVYCTECGTRILSTVYVVEATGDHIASEPQIHDYIEATCLKTGSYREVVSCIGCGMTLSETMKTLDIDPTNHIDGDDANHHCDRCGARDIEGHIKGEPVREDIVLPTCTEKGSYRSAVYCIECHAKLVYDYVAIDIDPTNHFDGDDADHDCDRCGAADIEGHTAGDPVPENIVSPTCTEKGTYHSVVYCTECGEKLSDTLGEIAINPNNHKDGDDEDHNCDYCGAIGFEDHIEGEPVREDVVLPTCMSNGSYHIVVYCIECGVKISDTFVEVAYDPNNHYDSDDANHNCDRCGAVDIEGHTAGAPVKERVVAATCAKKGSYNNVVYCTECGAILENVKIETPATNAHVEGYPMTYDHVKPTCTKKGSYREVVNCTFCNVKMGERIIELPPNYFDGHTAGEPVMENTVQPTCTKPGSYNNVIYCTECGTKLIENLVEIEITSNHTAGEAVKEIRIEATAESEGSYAMVVYCTECGEKLSEELFTIPALEGDDTTSVPYEPVASVFGEGSIITICVFAAVAILAAVLIPILKKKNRKGDK